MWCDGDDEVHAKEVVFLKKKTFVKEAKNHTKITLFDRFATKFATHIQRLSTLLLIHFLSTNSLIEQMFCYMDIFQKPHLRGIQVTSDNDS